MEAVNIPDSFLASSNLNSFDSTADLLEYFTKIQNDQIIITSLWENSNLEITEMRSQIVQWIFYVCEMLHFQNETAFKAIALLNIYLSESGKTQRMTAMESFSAEFQLLAVASLNIATKIEEINCSYMKFLTENVLNVGSPKKFTVREVALKEIEILRLLKFRTLFPTMYNFNKMFLEIAVNEITSSMDEYVNINKEFRYHFMMDPYFLSYLIKTNEDTLIRFSQKSESIFAPPIAGGLICLKASLYAVSNKMQIDLSFIFKSLDLICGFLIRDSLFLDYWDRVAFNFYSNEFTHNSDKTNFLSMAQDLTMKGNSIYKRSISAM